MIAEIQDAGGPVLTAVFVTKAESICCPTCAIVLPYPPKSAALLTPAGMIPIYVCPFCQTPSLCSAWKSPKPLTP